MKWILYISGLLLSNISMILAAGTHPHLVNTTTESKWLMLTRDPGGTEQAATDSLDELYSNKPSKLIGLQESSYLKAVDDQTKETVPLETTEQTFTEIVIHTIETVGENIDWKISDLTGTDKTLFETSVVTSPIIHENQAPSNTITTSKHVDPAQSVTSNSNFPKESEKSNVFSDQNPTESIVNKTPDKTVYEIEHTEAPVENVKNLVTMTYGGEHVTEGTPQTVVRVVTTTAERKKDGATTTSTTKRQYPSSEALARFTSLSGEPSTSDPMDLKYETQIVTELITRTVAPTTAYTIPTHDLSKYTVVDAAESQPNDLIKEGSQINIMDAFKTDLPENAGALNTEFQATKLAHSKPRKFSDVDTTDLLETYPPELEATSVITLPPTAVHMESEQTVTSQPLEEMTILTSVHEIFAQTTTDNDQLSVKSSPEESEVSTGVHGTSEPGIIQDGTTMSTSAYTGSSSLQTIPTMDEYVTGITTETYTSKEGDVVPEGTESHVVDLKEHTTIRDTEFKSTSAPVSKSEPSPVSDSVTWITSLETVPTTVDKLTTRDTPAGIERTDPVTIVTELQTVVETTIVLVEIVALRPPQLVSISSVTAHSAKVSWRASSKPAVKNFRVEYIGTFVDVKTTVVNVVGKANHVVIDGLKSGERYKFRVAAVSVSGTASDWSNTLQTDTVMIPLRVTTESIQERSLTVSWMFNTNVAVRETQVAYLGTAVDTLLRINTISNARTTTLTGLYPGDLYEVEITAFSPTNKQAFTNLQVGTRPFPPTLEPISYYNVSSVEIGVKPPTNSIVHSFNVSIQLQNHTEITYFHVLNLGSSVTNFVIPSLVSGGQYEISIACIGYGFYEHSRWTRVKHTAKLYAPMIQMHRTVVFMNRINLYWTFRDYIDCTHFLITYYAIHGAKMNSRTINPLRTSVQLQNLIPGETYTVIVKAVSEPEFASSLPVNITTNLGRLRVKPITSYTSTSITLSWVTSAANALIEYFVISYTGAHLDGQHNSVNVSGTERSYVLSDLTPGETYSIGVQARSGRQSVDGNHLSQTTIPSIPTGIDAPQTTTESIHLSWERPANSVVETYEIMYHSTADNIVREVLSPKEGYIMRSLEPGVVYNISIRAVSASEKSRMVSTIQRTKLAKPREIRVDAVTNTSVTLLWADPQGTYDDVRVSCDKCIMRERQIFPGISVAIFTKLSAGTEYRLSLVTEKSGFEDSLPTTIVVVTKPHTPDDLQLISYSETAISFAWVDKDCTSCFYRVICVASVDGWSFHDDLWHNNATHHEYSCNDLVPGELYTISVTSLINHDLSFRPPSLVIQQRTEPAIPNNINILTRTSQSITLAWEKAQGIFDYYTTRLVSSKHSLVANYTPEVTTIDRRNLDPFLGYDFYISTVSGRLTSETRHIHFNTREGRPGQVSLFKLMPVNPMKMSVHFKQPSEPNGRILSYRISYHGSSSNNKRTSLFETKQHGGQVEVPDNRTEMIFSSLRPGYNYSFSIMAKTTIGYGPELVKNASTPIWPPRATNIRPQVVQQDDLTSKSFPVEFDDSYFTDDYGEILYYSVIVAEAAAIVYDQQPESFDRPNVTMTTWSQAIGQDPIPPYQICEPMAYAEIRNGNDNLEYTGSLRVQRSIKVKRIEIGSESCSKGSHVYCNGPLSAGKTYVYNFRAYTEAGYTDTHFSSPISLPEDDGILIIIVLCALILLLIMVIILAVIFLRQNRKYGPDKPLLHRLSTHWSCKSDQDNPATPLVRCPNSKKYSRPIALSDFCHDYHQMVAHTHFGFSQEYESIQKVGKKLSWCAAVLPENVVKNRYSNILPYDRTRVKLTYIEGDEGSDYINASYIPGFMSPREFISCQGPLPGTIADMWRMVWELKISNVVMVTKLVERGKVRCDQYWPEDHKPVFFGDVIVTMTTKTETENSWHVREFMIQYGAKTRKVKHFHFLDWPDHGVPETSTPLIKFITTVRLHIPDDNTPTLVHCSAGVGRTGTFICLDRLIQHIEEFDYVDIMGIVCEMRFHRSFMVQTEQQYIFIHKCLLDILEEKGLAAKQISLLNGSVEHKV